MGTGNTVSLTVRVRVHVPGRCKRPDRVRVIVKERGALFFAYKRKLMSIPLEEGGWRLREEEEGGEVWYNKAAAAAPLKLGKLMRKAEDQRLALQLYCLRGRAVQHKALGGLARLMRQARDNELLLALHYPGCARREHPLFPAGPGGSLARPAAEQGAGVASLPAEPGPLLLPAAAAAVQEGVQASPVSVAPRAREPPPPRPVRFPDSGSVFAELLREHDLREEAAAKRAAEEREAARAPAGSCSADSPRPTTGKGKEKTRKSSHAEESKAGKTRKARKGREQHKQDRKDRRLERLLQLAHAEERDNTVHRPGCPHRVAPPRPVRFPDSGSVFAELLRDFELRAAQEEAAARRAAEEREAARRAAEERAADTSALRRGLQHVPTAAAALLWVVAVTVVRALLPTPAAVLLVGFCVWLAMGMPALWPDGPWGPERAAPEPRRFIPLPPGPPPHAPRPTARRRRENTRGARYACGSKARRMRTRRKTTGKHARNRKGRESNARERNKGGKTRNKAEEGKFG